ncbi:uncharacterized protein BP5553_05150 [Venustampulla echinocandica]|uniref:Uncharacterized protein n=1 Tax=Venustampulla echinocandica TaxID=2656787 RepID=A0A370TQA9_9HELO|nr:uncharacterized protein BP5553_05150 [Venustampulla echinocandica]RDL37717.1 hypothetical protein BP5553_05150 [Venustampulla echinocandica]
MNNAKGPEDSSPQGSPRMREPQYTAAEKWHSAELTRARKWLPDTCSGSYANTAARLWTIGRNNRPKGRGLAEDAPLGKSLDVKANIMSPDQAYPHAVVGSQALSNPN